MNDSSFGYQADAASFMSATTVDLDHVDVAVEYYAGSPDFVLQLDSDNGGQPGSVLASWTFTSIPNDGSCCELDTETATSTVSLSAGGTYWLVALPGANTTFDGWQFNNTGATGMMSYQTSPGGTYDTVTNSLPAFDVWGDTPAAESVPEPASCALLAVGFLIFPLFRKLLRQRSAS